MIPGPVPSHLDCGHPGRYVSGRPDSRAPTRCWDCHLAHLRSTGQDARADRLLEIRRQLNEGRFDFDALMEGLAERIIAEYGRRPQEAEPRRQRTAKKLNSQEGRP